MLLCYTTEVLWSEAVEKFIWKKFSWSNHCFSGRDIVTSCKARSIREGRIGLMATMLGGDLPESSFVWRRCWEKVLAGSEAASRP